MMFYSSGARARASRRGDVIPTMQVVGGWMEDGMEWNEWDMEWNTSRKNLAKIVVIL